MKLTKLKLAIIGGALVFASCKKNEQELTPQIIDNGALQIGGDAIALKSFFTNNENQAKQIFSVNVASPQLITGNQGVKIQFDANSFKTMSGQPIVGNVDVELIEILNKKEMILQNKPTVANSPMGGVAPLISGGEFKLSVSQSGQPLKLTPGYRYSATVPAPNGIDPRMDIFYGDTTNDTLVWNQADSANLWGDSSQTNYNGYFDSLGWINCDYFYSDPRPKTYVDVQIPSGFTNNTCALFVSFDGLNSITSFYDYSASVYSSTYQLPVGLNVNFVLIAMVGGSLQVAIVPATIANNHLEVVSGLTSTTAAQFAIDLSNLP
jgi:hypothetical protein